MYECFESLSKSYPLILLLYFLNISFDRTLFWTNSNIGKPTIEKSSLEGQDRAIIVETGLFKPMAITISKGAERYLYWVDEKGYHFTIERFVTISFSFKLLLHSFLSFFLTKKSVFYETECALNQLKL